jgi:hypothetical protein
LTKEARAGEGAREAVANSDNPDTWSGPGRGQLCSGCSKPIGFDEVEIEVEAPVMLKSSVFRFHPQCYRIWSGEYDGREIG